MAMLHTSRPLFLELTLIKHMTTCLPMQEMTSVEVESLTAEAHVHTCVLYVHSYKHVN